MRYTTTSFRGVSTARLKWFLYSKSELGFTTFLEILQYYPKRGHVYLRGLSNPGLRLDEQAFQPLDYLSFDEVFHGYLKHVTDPVR